MNIEFLEPAFIEYKEAVEFYNFQVKELGNKFIDEIDKTLSIIKKYPDGFVSYSITARKARLNKFPYNIIYTIHNKTIIVIAISHQHREPNYWKGR